MAEQSFNPGEVVFIVGEHQVRCVAVRGLLAISTPVFRELFESNLKDNTTNEIKLPSINAEAFQIMLEFINGINIKNKINQTNMCNLLNISTKYKLPKLIQLTTRIVKQSLNKTNIIQIFRFAQESNDEGLKQLIWKWLARKSINISDPIINQIFKLFQTGQDIADLLQKEYITINEERIFTFCSNWLRLQYQKTDKQQLSARELTKEFIQFIRFPLMSNKFLSTDVYNTGNFP